LARRGGEQRRDAAGVDGDALRRAEEQGIKQGECCDLEGEDANDIAAQPDFRRRDIWTSRRQLLSHRVSLGPAVDGFNREPASRYSQR